RLLSTQLSPSPLLSLSLHDALPISLLLPVEHDGGQQPAGAQFVEEGPRAENGDPVRGAGPHRRGHVERGGLAVAVELVRRLALGDRKSTRLNSSHGSISYAVFCLKK